MKITIVKADKETDIVLATTPRIGDGITIFKNELFPDIFYRVKDVVISENSIKVYI